MSRRDRRVYLSSHPLLFALLAATRGRGVRRIGATVLAHSTTAFRDGLTRVPLDRTAAGTTGGAAGELTGGDLLFNQDGSEHRGARRGLALGAGEVDRLRPVWNAVLDHGLAPLAGGGTIELVELAAEMAGATAAALLRVDVAPRELATAARAAAAAAAREHLPGLPRPWRRDAARVATERLTGLLAAAPPAVSPSVGSSSAVPGATPAAFPADTSTAVPDATPAAFPADTSTAVPGATPAAFPAGASTAFPGAASLSGAASAPAASGEVALSAMLAVAAINTTVAAVPRAAAWCADSDLWHYAETHLEALTSEMLRVTAPTPLLPRVAAADGVIDGCPVRAGDRLILVTRHAVDAHRRQPCPADPAPAQTAQLVFGTGPHACPGARLARLQLSDALQALARFRPRVVSARVDRRSALPAWSRLTLAPTR
ncbi:cytochrome P450 [Actinoplanes sp. SE50]|uniref:cytochrome P450 n=1 Tax=unclassified Actinoplanes TaxID=2626549 RepID=UPI00023EBB3A|nr:MULTISPECIES: cytochrome P450 [unclassified Actinoplanes]AEV82880.1 Flavonoid 3',5'-hydroxylase 2 [Actinoplanes sp. SE50/110]ATO81276.1 cytochrome P450 [Actinoplanes sp. SE50]SLL98683.1 cytochrome P450 [Actinoplanes sp. SE50/110]